jgi:hypothetical protein
MPEYPPTNPARSSFREALKYQGDEADKLVFFSRRRDTALVLDTVGV